MTRIADILFRARDTLIYDVLGILALVALTLALLHLPSPS